MADSPPSCPILIKIRNEIPNSHPQTKIQQKWYKYMMNQIITNDLIINFLPHICCEPLRRTRIQPKQQLGHSGLPTNSVLLLGDVVLGAL